MKTTCVRQIKIFAHKAQAMDDGGQTFKDTIREAYQHTALAVASTAP